jgi:hypothetical protein
MLILDRTQTLLGQSVFELYDERNLTWKIGWPCRISSQPPLVSLLSVALQISSVADGGSLEPAALVSLVPSSAPLRKVYLHYSLDKRSSASELQFSCLMPVSFQSTLQQFNTDYVKLPLASSSPSHIDSWPPLSREFSALNLRTITHR